jgi:hypothetical protein
LKREYGGGFLVQGIEPGASWMLSTLSTTELYFSPIGAFGSTLKGGFLESGWMEADQAI